MRLLWISILTAFLAGASAPALADDVAEQRARLANQRIQIEEERRIQAEEERLAREEAERLSQEARVAAERQAMAERAAAVERAVADERARQAAIPVEDDVASDVSAERMEMSRALEQLRELGALRDAGYVTDEEFAQLKRKILDAAL